MSDEKPAPQNAVVIKKYANRRLYNTSTSTYVTLDDLAVMVKGGTDFLVYDAKSGDDITRSVLTQIIFEEENKGTSMLPINFLRQLIRFYGDSMQAFVPGFLEFSLDNLGKEQDKHRGQMMEAWGADPFKAVQSIIALWERAAEALCAAGATLEEVDFPLVSNYDRDRLGARSMVERGLVPAEFAQAEGWDLITFAWHDYLVANGDPKLASLKDVDGSLIIPLLPGAERDRYEGLPSFAEYPLRARQGVTAPNNIPHLAAGLRGLEATRKRDLEDWIEARGLDFLVFPAVADVAPADADYNPRSADIAWRNGVWVANGNQVIRHCGVPTVTVAMGVMDDIGMPVGLTFAGRAYDDNSLLSAAYAFEVTRQRAAPARLPPLDDDRLPLRVMSRSAGAAPTLTFDATLSAVDDGQVTIVVHGTARGDAVLTNIAVYINGEALAVQRDGENFTASVVLPYTIHYYLHSRWRGPYGSIVLVRVDDSAGGCSAGYRVVGGVG